MNESITKTATYCFHNTMHLWLRTVCGLRRWRMASGVSVRTIQQFVEASKETIAPEAQYDGPVDQSPVARLASDAVREAAAPFIEKPRN